MNKYFVFVNWMMAIILFAIYHFITPLLGVSFLIGAIVGGMCTTGLISWQYHKDGNPQKEEKWLFGFFGKNYKVEVLFAFSIAVIAFGMHFLFWSAFWRAIMGVAVMLFCYNLLEVLWRSTFHKYIVKQWMKKK